MSRQREQMIILHRYPFRESSYIIKGLSANGPISLVAKGARRAKSAFLGVLEPLSLVEVEYVNKTTRDLHTLYQANRIEYFTQMRSQLERQADAQVLAELVLRVYQDGGEHPAEVFRLLLSYLRLLDSPNLQTPRSQYVLIRFLHDFCEEMGFGLQLDVCTQCGHSLQQEIPAGINQSAGGAICKKCISPELSVWQPPFLVSLHNAVHKNLVEISAYEQKLLEDFFIQYLELHLGHKWRWNSLDYRRGLTQ